MEFRKSMKNTLTATKGAILLLLVGILIASCGGGAPATPTTDPNAILTEVAQTVMVSITQTAEAMPTATETPIPPTQTPQPLFTDTPAVSTQPTLASQPGYPTPTIQRFGDSAWEAAQSPVDGSQHTISSIGQFHFCLINNGTTTWTSAYYLAYASGWNLWPSQSTYSVNDETVPGKKWCFDLNVVYPESVGEYMTRWYFKNNRDAIVLEVYYHFFTIQ